jgi:hypothetical protein
MLNITEIESNLANKFNEIKTKYAEDLNKLYEISIPLFGSKFSESEEVTIEQAKSKVEYFIALQIKTALLSFIQNTPPSDVKALLITNVSKWLTSKDLTKIPFLTLFDFKDYMDYLINLIVDTVYTGITNEANSIPVDQGPVDSTPELGN